MSALFSDLAGFTSFSEHSDPSQVAELLSTYYEVAAPLISRQFGGEVEKFIADGMMATFNSRGDQPDCTPCLPESVPAKSGRVQRGGIPSAR